MALREKLFIGGGGMVFGVAMGAVGALALTGQVFGSDAGLSKEGAERLVAREYERGVATCVWQDPTKRTDTRWSFSPFREDELRCVTALESEGLLRRGECAESGCGGPDNCCAQWIEAVKPAELSQPERGLVFPCGRFVLQGVTSVRTEGSRSAVRFRRTFTPDTERLARLESCKMDKPEAGAAEKLREYVRDDAGNWAAP